jgi:hypothetical protein
MTRKFNLVQSIRRGVTKWLIKMKQYRKIPEKVIVFPKEICKYFKKKKN